MSREPPADDSAADLPHHEDCDGGDDCRCAEEPDGPDFDDDGGWFAEEDDR